MFEYIIGEYFVDKNILTYDRFREMIDDIRDDKTLLGSLAISENMLTLEQVDEIHKIQQTVDKRFGDIAVEQSKLSREQLDALIQKQHDIHMLFFRRLDETGILNSEQLHEELESFRKHYRLTDTQMDALLTDDMDTIISLFVKTQDYYMNDYMSTALKYIMRFVNNNFRIGAIRRVDNYFAERIALQKVVSNRGRYFIGFASDKSTLQAFNDRLKGFTHNLPNNRYSFLFGFLNCISCIFTCDVNKELQINEITNPVVYKFTTMTVNGSCYSLPIFIDELQLDLIVASGAMPNFVTVSHNV